MEQFETRFDSGLDHLSPGCIWSTPKRGVFVVLASRRASWRGEDRDVYAHIDTWHTCRPATPDETTRWERYLAAFRARKAQRTATNTAGWTFDGCRLVPNPAGTRRLDSYDDRWEPPTALALTPEQIAVEEEYVAAQTGITGAA